MWEQGPTWAIRFLDEHTGNYWCSHIAQSSWEMPDLLHMHISTNPEAHNTLQLQHTVRHAWLIRLDTLKQVSVFMFSKMSLLHVFGSSPIMYLNAVLFKIHLQNKLERILQSIWMLWKSIFKYGFFMLVVTCFRVYETVGLRTVIERQTDNTVIWLKYTQAIHHLSQSNWLWRADK